jgi:methionine-gamma-lyase
LKTVLQVLASHPSHNLYASMINPEYGLGNDDIRRGILAKANALMELMQSKPTGYWR